MRMVRRTKRARASPQNRKRRAFAGALIKKSLKTLRPPTSFAKRDEGRQGGCEASRSRECGKQRARARRFPLPAPRPARTLCIIYLFSLLNYLIDARAKE